MAEKKSFVLYGSMQEAVNSMSDEDAGLLLKAVFSYVNDGELLELPAGAQMAFIFIRGQIDRDTQKYLDICAKRRKSIQKRYETTSEYKSKQEYSSATDNDNDNDNDNEYENDNDNEYDNDNVIKGSVKGKRKPRFSPPSVADVKVYCDERKNAVDPDTFVNFYEAKGWMVGKNPMKDWKAAVRTWEKDERRRGQGYGSDRQTAGQYGDIGHTY